MFVLSFFAQAQTNADGIAFPLWPDGAPGALGKADEDIPTLTPFLADPRLATGAAMVVCPGGGYGGLAAHEGKEYGLWLRANGI
ncbi:MAG: endo,4-beta-xylanase, partial [Pedosphaera sp.]|nr:endo,4-beta-xylanase [Pedosphaera sp.]